MTVVPGAYTLLVLSAKLTRMIEEALAHDRPLTLTAPEVRQLADRCGIKDPRALDEPIAGIGYVGDGDEFPPMVYTRVLSDEERADVVDRLNDHYKVF